MKKILAALVVLLLIPLSVSAQDACEGNFDCDQDVDGTDAGIFKEDFGRNLINNPCPPCNPCPYNMIDCGNKCVDPMTDTDFCGADSTCFGGRVCGTTEKCVSGVCEQMVASCDIPAPVPKTGQTISYINGDDGDLEKGVAWPNPRFTDNGDGTVTDNLSGLIWLKDSNCAYTAWYFPDLGRMRWDEAFDFIAGINDGTYPLCGAGHTDWRFPNVRELFSLIDVANYSPSAPTGHPFTNLYSRYYFSSTTYFVDEDFVWIVSVSDGTVIESTKGYSRYVWPVRGPE